MRRIPSPVSACSFLNVDDLAAELKDGTYRAFPQSTRDQVKRLTYAELAGKGAGPEDASMLEEKR